MTNTNPPNGTPPSGAEQTETKQVAPSIQHRSSWGMIAIVASTFAVWGSLLAVSTFVNRAQMREYAGTLDDRAAKAAKSEVVLAARGLAGEIAEELKKPLKEAIAGEAPNLTLPSGFAQLKKDIQHIKSAVDRLAGKGAQAPKPKAVFVVLPAKETDEPASRDMALGIDDVIRQDRFAVSIQDPKGTMSVEYIDLVEICVANDAENTIARIRSEAQTYDCVLVLGHAHSTLAKDVCSQYYVPEGIPVILLGPTNPSITEDFQKRPEPERLILRLLPTDVVQVEKIIEYVEESDFRTILIGWDFANQTYSSYIADAVGARLKRMARERGISRRVYPFPVWAKDRATLDFSKLLAYDPDLLIFVGLSPAGEAMIETWERDAAAAGPAATDLTSKLKVLFTDGCTNREFREFIVGRSGWGPMVILSPMPQSQTSDPTALLSYRPLGMVAAGLAQRILEDAGKKGTISRRSVARVVDLLARKPTVTTLRIDVAGDTRALLPDELRRVNFSHAEDGSSVDGDNREWEYHYYLVVPKLEYLGKSARGAADRIRRIEAGANP